MQTIPFLDMGEAFCKSQINREQFTTADSEEAEGNQIVEIKNKFDPICFTKTIEEKPLNINQCNCNIKQIDLNSRVADDIPTRPPLSC